MPTLIQRIRKFFFRLPDWHYKIQENAMGYRSYEEMYSDYQSMIQFGFEPLYLRRGKPVTLHQSQSAMIVYGRAGRPKLNFLVLGRLQDQAGEDGVSSLEYNFIDNAMLNNFYGLSEERGEKGSILNSDNWTFLMNDLFMSGGVANNQPFYLASRRTAENLWDRNEGHITIYGRELAGLFAAGYELVHLQDGSEAMVPPCENESRFLSMRMNFWGLKYFLENDNLAFIYHPKIRKFEYDIFDKTFDPIFYR